MKAKDYLKQINKLEYLIKNKSYEKARWHDCALSITVQQGGERVQTSGSKHGMADALDRCADIDLEIAGYRQQVNEIINTIEQLNADDYDILHCLYVQGLSYKEVADRHGKSYSHITTAHGRALERLQKILNGREKNAENIPEKKQENGKMN